MTYAAQRPNRDAAGMDGLHWSRPGGLPRPHVHTHMHVTPDGIPVECTSQLVVSLGLVRDRYSVHGWEIARGVRNAETENAHETPPGWAWTDARSAPNPIAKEIA